MAVNLQHYYSKRRASKRNNFNLWISMIASWVIIGIGSFYAGYEKSQYDIERGIERAIEAIDRGLSGEFD